MLVDLFLLGYLVVLMYRERSMFLISKAMPTVVVEAMTRNKKVGDAHLRRGDCLWTPVCRNSISLTNRWARESVHCKGAGVDQKP